MTASFFLHANIAVGHVTISILMFHKNIVSLLSSQSIFLWKNDISLDLDLEKKPEKELLSL